MSTAGNRGSRPRSGSAVHGRSPPVDRTCDLVTLCNKYRVLEPTLDLDTGRCVCSSSPGHPAWCPSSVRRRAGTQRLAQVRIQRRRPGAATPGRRTRSGTYRPDPARLGQRGRRLPTITTLIPFRRALQRGNSAKGILPCLPPYAKGPVIRPARHRLSPWRRIAWARCTPARRR